MERINTTQESLELLLAQPLTGEDGWFKDVRLSGTSDAEIAEQYRSYTLREIFRGFELRLQDPLVFIAPTPEMLPVFQPALEVYDDTAFFHGAPGESDLSTAFRAYHDLARNTFCLALLHDGDMTAFRPIEAAMRARVEENLRSEGATVDGDQLDSVLSPAVFLGPLQNAFGSIRF
jgi:hypothetical protein